MRLKYIFSFLSRGRGDGNETYDQKLVYIECLQVLLCKIYIALHTQAGQTAKEKMRITQVRDDGKVNTMRTLKIEQLVEQMKKETKAQLVSLI